MQRQEGHAMNRLDGKIAFISGGARGIGAETARLMVQAGAKVVIGDVNDERGRETARNIAGTGGEAQYLHLDVTSEEDWARGIGATVDRFGGLDILVNNAAILLGKGIEEVTLDEWHRLAASTLPGCFSAPRPPCRRSVPEARRASTAAPSSTCRRSRAWSAHRRIRSIQ